MGSTVKPAFIRFLLSRHISKKEKLIKEEVSFIQSFSHLSCSESATLCIIKRAHGKNQGLFASWYLGNKGKETPGP